MCLSDGEEKAAPPTMNSRDRRGAGADSRTGISRAEWRCRARWPVPWHGNCFRLATRPGRPRSALGGSAPLPANDDARRRRSRLSASPQVVGGGTLAGPRPCDGGTAPTATRCGS
jgi:hypothetical protein